MPLISLPPTSHTPLTMNTVQVCSSELNFPAFTLLANHLSGPFVTAELLKLLQQFSPHIFSIKGTPPVSVIYVCFVSDMPNVFLLNCCREVCYQIKYIVHCRLAYVYFLFNFFFLIFGRVAQLRDISRQTDR